MTNMCLSYCNIINRWCHQTEEQVPRLWLYNITLKPKVDPNCVTAGCVLGESDQKSPYNNLFLINRVVTKMPRALQKKVSSPFGIN